MAHATTCTWNDWLALPEADNGRRYELVDGQLVVSAAPGYRHQRALNVLQTHLTNWTWDHGGQVLPGPFDVYVTEGNYYEPDLLFVREERRHLFEERGLRGPPDLVVEVSSPASRDYDMGTKRQRYEEAGVGEYWFVDLDRDEVASYHLTSEGYGEPDVRRRGDVLESTAARGFTLAVDTLLGPGG